AHRGLVGGRRSAAVRVLELVARDRREVDVDEVLVGEVLAGGDGVVIDLRRRDVRPTGAVLLLDQVVARHQAGERVGAGAIGGGLRHLLAAVGGVVVVGVIVERDRPAAHRGLVVGRPSAAVLVLELVARDRREVDVDEVLVGEVLAGGDGVVIDLRRRDVRPTGAVLLLDQVVARHQAGERVGAGAIGGGLRHLLAAVGGVVVVGVIVERDRPAAHRGLVGGRRSAAVRVLELVARDRREVDVDEVLVGEVLAGGDGVVIDLRRRDVRPTG